MSSTRIFTVGGTVQAGGGLYIPRVADEELIELCRKGIFAYVLTPRQMGKSSLMVRTANQLGTEGTRTVIIDLTQIGVEVSAEEWYGGILAIIEDRLELDADVFDWWESHKDLSVTQRLSTFFEEVVLAHTDGKVVIFIDEIDTTLGIPFTDDFFAAIRFIYNARAVTPAFNRLSFVLIGVATPGDLINDAKRTPFNIGTRVDLTDFSLDEARPFAAGLGLPEKLASSVLEWTLKWTSGHPYLTQRLCRAVVEEDREDWTEGDLDKLVEATFFGSRSEQDNNLQFVRDMLTKRANEKAAVLETYRDVRRSRNGVPDETSSLVKSQLKLSGIVRKDNSMLRLRNPIYSTVFDRNWINANWPDSWIKRNASSIIRVGIVAVIGLAIFSTIQWSRASLLSREVANQRDQERELRVELQGALVDERQAREETAEARDKAAEEGARNFERVVAQAQEISRLETLNQQLGAMVSAQDLEIDQLKLTRQDLQNQIEGLVTNTNEEVEVLRSAQDRYEQRISELNQELATAQAARDVSAANSQAFVNVLNSLTDIPELFRGPRNDNPLGIWAIEMNTPLGAVPSELIFFPGGAGLLTGDLGDQPISGIVYDENTISFSVDLDAQGQTLVLTFDGTVDGDDLTGEFGSDFGAFGVTGTRTN